MSNGWIAEYKVYLCEDGQNWGEPISIGKFQKGRDKKKIAFRETHNARFIRFVAVSGFDGQIFASIAELDVIPASK